MKLFPGGRAVLKIQIDQTLVGDAAFLGQRPKPVDGVLDVLALERDEPATRDRGLDGHGRVAAALDRAAAGWTWLEKVANALSVQAAPR